MAPSVAESRRTCRAPSPEGEIIRGGCPSRARRSAAVPGKNGGGSFLGRPRAGKKRHQFTRPKFINFAPNLPCPVVDRHAQTGRNIDKYLPVHIASFDRRNSGNKPAFDALGAKWPGQIARDRAKLHSLQVRARRRKMRCARFRPARSQTVDDLKQERPGSGAPDKCGIRAAVEIADPNSRERNDRKRRPTRHRENRATFRFSKKPARSRLESAQFISGRGTLAEHFERKKRGFGRQNAPAVRENGIARQCGAADAALHCWRARRKAAPDPASKSPRRRAARPVHKMIPDTGRRTPAFAEKFV